MAGRVRGTRAACLTLLVLLPLLAGCGGEGGSGERPSLSPSISPTRTLPSPTRSSILTDEPTEEPTEEPTVTESAAPRPTETPTTSPPPAQTSEPETSAPETPDTSEPPSSPSEDELSAGNEESAEDGIPAWVWWLLAGVLAAVVVVVAALATRARRRRLWHERLQSAGTDVAWLARELLPQLRDTGSLERVAGGWQVGLPRVTALEDKLTVLESSARAEDDGARARALRDAVRSARARVDALTAGGPQETWAVDLDETIAVLEAALAQTAQPGL